MRCFVWFLNVCPFITTFYPLMNISVLLQQLCSFLEGLYLYIFIPFLFGLIQLDRTYVVSSPIIAYYYTQLIGDARNPPTLLASSSFSGMAVIGKKKCFTS